MPEHSHWELIKMTLQEGLDIFKPAEPKLDCAIWGLVQWIVGSAVVGVILGELLKKVL